MRSLKDIPTKELLRMRVAARVLGVRIRGVPRAGRGKSRAYREVDAGDGGFTLQEILAELATREHVPNKAEARRIRQQRAQDDLERCLCLPGERCICGAGRGPW